MSSKIQFNQISNRLKTHVEQQIQKYKGVLRFQLLNYTELNVPVGTGGFAVKKIYKSAYGLPSRDRILDPEIKKSIDIAVIDNYDDQGNAVYAQKYVLEQSDGLFTLRADDPNDLMWLEFLLLSNFNRDNPFRNEAVEPLFGVVDELAKADEILRLADLKRDALIAAASMKNGECVDFAAAIGWNESDEPKIIKARILGLAEKDPEMFRSLIEDGEMEYRSALKKAITRGIVTYNPTENSLHWANGEKFALLAGTQGKTYLEQYADWVRSHNNGIVIHKNIKELLSKK